MPTPVSLTDTSTDLVHRHGADVDPPALRCELDGVRQEIQHDLLDLPLVRPYVAQPRVDRRSQRDAPPAGPLADEDQGVVDGRGQVEVRQLELHPPGLDLGEIEDVVDQGEQVLGGGGDLLQIGDERPSCCRSALPPAASLSSQ